MAFVYGGTGTHGYPSLYAEDELPLEDQNEWNNFNWDLLSRKFLYDFGQEEQKH